MKEERISYIKLPNITVSRLQDVVNYLDDNEIEYVEYYAEDLQNRIDKAIEYIKHYETIRGYYEYEECGYDEYNYEEDLKEELLDVLKESGE